MSKTIFAVFDANGRVLTLAGGWRFETRERAAEVISWYPKIDPSTVTIAPCDRHGKKL